MIQLLAIVSLGSLQQVDLGNVLVTELPDPAAKRLRVEIVASLPDLDRVRWAEANLLASCIAKGTRNFTAHQLLQYATATGDPIKTSISEDHIRIGFTVPPNDIRLALELSDELMRGALLSDSTVQLEIDEAPFRKRSAWNEAWLPFELEYKDVTPHGVRALYGRIFRPGNVSIAVGGVLSPSAGRKSFAERFATWQPPKPERYRPTAGARRRLAERNAPLSTVTFLGPTSSVIPVVSNAADVKNDGSLGPLALAVAMMGLGKGATAFLTLREGLGLSYRQEAMLVPAEGGLAPALIVGVKAGADLHEFGDKARNALLEAVEKWTDENKKRTIALTKASQDLSLPLGFLYFAEERPLGHSLEDRTFLAAYWRMKTGKMWNWNTVLAEMEATSVEEAKSVAQSWLRQGSTVNVQGSK